jgi:hypothetical protein
MAALALMNQNMGIELLSVDIRSGSAQDVSVSRWETIGQPAWSADGSRIFAPAVPITERFIEIMQIWKFDARTGAHKPLTSGSIPYQLGTLSATTTGDLLANTRSPVMSLWVANASSQPRLLPATRSEGWDSVAWVDQQIVTNNYIYPELMFHEPDGRTTQTADAFGPLSATGSMRPGPCRLLGYRPQTPVLYRTNCSPMFNMLEEATAGKAELVALPGIEPGFED